MRLGDDPRAEGPNSRRLACLGEGKVDSDLGPWTLILEKGI